MPHGLQTNLVSGCTRRSSRYTVFIARDNPNRAMSFGYELISETDRLQEFPELGRIVPEYRNDDVREIIFRPYRIVYRVIHDESFARLHASGIPREEFQNCKS